jgi:multidrug efflux pump subunit AcrA (membrane-fusion protein)
MLTDFCHICLPLIVPFLCNKLIVMKTRHGLALFFCLSILFTACTESSDGVHPEEIALTESVYSSVIIEPDSFYKVYVATRGIVDEIMVQEGDPIGIGDLIARIVDDNSKLASENAQLEMNLAKKNYEGTSSLIDDLKNELVVAELNLKNDSINYERQQRLWSEKIGSKTDFEKRQLAYQTSLNKYNTLKRQLERKQDELKIALQKSKNNYENRLNQQADFEIRSRVNGKVYELLKEVGESVNDQEPFALLGSSNEFIVKMQVDEVDIVRINTGQLIYVTLDAYENQVFEAVVTQIIPQMKQETQTFWVKGTFVNPPKVLYSGLRGEANVVIAQKEKTLTIPLEYLINSNKVLTENGTLTVSTGLRSLERVEIIEGLDSSTVILKP